MTDTGSKIITQVHVDRMFEQLGALKHIDREIQLATRAGFDVQDAQKVVEESRDKLRRMTGVYAPGRLE